MKREFLEGLNLSKDVIDQIMAENGKDINAQKSLTDAETAKLTTANQTIKQLRDTVSAFDGVDVKKLQGDLTALQNKYNTDINNLKLDNALDRELRANNVRSTKAARALLNLDKIKLDGDKLLGFDDQITALKASDAYLFAETKAETKAQEKPGTYVDSGKPHGDAVGSAPTTLHGALAAHYEPAK